MTQYERIKIRRFLMKEEAIRLKGEKCLKCGWSGHSSAFDFHHRDPSMKKSLISDLVRWEDLIKELEKCDLLCSNCHRIHHSMPSDNDFLDKVRSYKGRSLVCIDSVWKNGNNPLTKKKKKKTNPNWRTSDRINKRKVVRPPKENLIALLKEMPISKISKQFNVTDNAIRKWCERYDIDYKHISPFSLK